ncbi:MAG: glutamine amidotransferase [Flavobacteriales bacterium]|jgi:glutamine amidotransferase
MTQTVAIIDYGMGNLHSVASALGHVAPDVKHIITSDHDVVRNADRVIFPGVGAIRDCVGEIRRLGFDTLVRDVIDSGKPVLAICVGLQALMQHSAENNGVECLGHFDGRVEFFSQSEEFQASRAASTTPMKVPHMGWNRVKQTRAHPMWEGIDDNSRFYFVHSYYVNLNDKSVEAGTTDYGLSFSSVLSKDNVFATQFHPEKSHNAGLQLFKNFVHWDGRA